MWVAAAAKGHVGVIRSVVEALQSTAKDRTGVDTGNFKDPTIITLTWSRFLRDVLNAQTSVGETALMLACQNGCVLPCQTEAVIHASPKFAQRATCREGDGDGPTDIAVS